MTTIPLGQVAARLPMLDIACTRCDRAGRLNTARLVAEHGPDFPMTDLRRIVAADCPRWAETRIMELCGVRFPGLMGVFLGKV